MKIHPLFFLFFCSAFIPVVQAAEYEIDPGHSAVTFKVRHLLAFVNGTFDKVEGRFNYVPGKPEDWSVQAKIQSDSINTRLEQRDNHLKSDDFLDTQHYPELVFKSTRVTDYKDGKAKLHGILSLHGVDKEVVLDLIELGADKDPWGNELAGFSAQGMINRKDFGLVWNQIAESGKLLVGEEIFITLDVEGKTVVSQSSEEQQAVVEGSETVNESLVEQPVS